VYNDPGVLAEQEEFDALVRSGAGSRERERFILTFYNRRAPALRNVDFHALDPRTVEQDRLLPRRDIDRFVLDNWVRHIFLAALPASVSGSLFMFGLGRIFSKANDMGVQSCTDADLNVIASDTLPKAEFERLGRGIDDLARTVLDRFGIAIELHPEYTLMTEGQVIRNFAHPDPSVRNASALFYKSNERIIHVFKDHPGIRERVFAPVRPLPDRCLFEHLLGAGSAKTTFTKLRNDISPLAVILDGTCERVRTNAVIGSVSFGRRNRKVFGLDSFVSPPEWYFSMKYSVNRAYDYVSSMLHAGHSLEELGFGAKSLPAEKDPDYRFLRNAHALMLYLQEILHSGAEAFGAHCDYSYVSRQRFLRFMELHGDKFRKDFDGMIIGGELLPLSSRRKYELLRNKIAGRTRDRFMEGRTKDLALLPPGFKYDSVHKDANTYRICVPYSWADLGYFAFCDIAARMARIVDAKLAPAAAKL